MNFKVGDMYREIGGGGYICTIINVNVYTVSVVYDSTAIYCYTHKCFLDLFSELTPLEKAML